MPCPGAPLHRRFEIHESIWRFAGSLGTLADDDGLEDNEDALVDEDDDDALVDDDENVSVHDDGVDIHNGVDGHDDDVDVQGDHDGTVGGDNGELKKNSDFSDCIPLCHEILAAQRFAFCLPCCPATWRGVQAACVEELVHHALWMMERQQHTSGTCRLGHSPSMDGI